MNDENQKPGDPKQARRTVAFILTIFCVLSGIYSCVQLAKFLPVWLAVIITFAVGFVLVGCLTESLGNDLLDIGVGCVVVVIVMTVALPVFAKSFRPHYSPPSKIVQPPAAQLSGK